jgi:hypothetical protein
MRLAPRADVNRSFKLARAAAMVLLASSLGACVKSTGGRVAAGLAVAAVATVANEAIKDATHTRGIRADATDEEAERAIERARQRDLDREVQADSDLTRAKAKAAGEAPSFPSL